MRCSDCFAEMKQGPDGLVCTACGTTLEPLIEEGQPALPGPERASKRSWVTWIILAFAILFIGGIAGTLTLSETARDAIVSAFVEEPASTGAAPSIVANDPDNLIINTLELAQDGEVANVFAGLVCQSVPGQAEGATLPIEWVTFSHEVSATLRASLPQNWKLLEICRDRAGQVFASASLADGLAISKIDRTGGLAWMRILPVSSGRIAEARLDLVNGQIMVLAPSSVSGNFSLTSFSIEGEQLFERPVPNVARGARPVLTTSSVGDTVLAWPPATSADGVSLRLRALSPQNTINYDTELSDRSVPVAAAVSDDLARTLLIEGRNGFSAQFVSAAGNPVWRRWVDPDAQPIGAVLDGPDFIVAAIKGEDLAFWRLREDGARSDPVMARLSREVSRALLVSSEPGRAILTLEGPAGVQTLLLIDLKRVPIVANLDAASSPRLDEFSSETSTPIEQPQVVTPPVEPEPETIAVNADFTLAPEEVLPTGPANGSEPQSSVQARPKEAEPRPAPIQTVSAPTQPVLAPEPAEASCTFRCAAIENPGATYPIMQTIALDEGETLSLLQSRLGPTHKKLCEVSGGQLVVESVPNCIAQ